MAALALVLAPLAACQQADQKLPFELDGGGQTTMGISGGLISIPPSFSLQFPENSLGGNTTVTAAERLTAFPAAAGAVVSGLAFDVGPSGTQLLEPALVQIAVPTELLAVGEQLALSVALLTQGGSIVTPVATYDLTSGLLTAEIVELGALAAVVSPGMIPIGELADIPGLGGGSIAPPAPTSTPAGPLGVHVPGSVVFEASCSTLAQQCFSSGILQVWADDVVYEHLGADIALLNTTVSGSIEFFAFVNNVPTQAIAYIEVTGDLRTRLNSVVAGRRLDDEVLLFTGSGTSPSATTVTFSGGNMILAQTSEPNDPYFMQYSVSGIGTGEQLTLRLQGELEFTDANGDPEIGTVVAHVRLRR